MKLIPKKLIIVFVALTVAIGVTCAKENRTPEELYSLGNDYYNGNNGRSQNDKRLLAIGRKPQNKTM